MIALANRKALITGASKGLGYAIAQKLAALGCSTTLVARNEKLLRQNVENLPVVCSNQKHTYISYDLQHLVKDDIDSPQYSSIMNSLENLSILVNCAGITSHNLFARTKVEDIQSIINLNLISPIVLSQLAYKPMSKSYLKSSQLKESQTPIILNISSVLSITDKTLPGTSVYAASKAGLIGFTKSLAAELKGKIRVNSILPGLIAETDMGSKVKSDKLQPVSMDLVADKSIEIIKNNSLNGECIIIK